MGLLASDFLRARGGVKHRIHVPDTNPVLFAGSRKVLRVCGDAETGNRARMSSELQWFSLKKPE